MAGLAQSANDWVNYNRKWKKFKFSENFSENNQ